MSSLFDHGPARRDANYEPLTPVDFIARAAQAWWCSAWSWEGAVRRTWAQTWRTRATPGPAAWPPLASSA